MAYSTIVKPQDYFNTVGYTGNGASDRAVTSGFATDFVWIKNRGTTDDHVLFDKVRGGTKYLYSNQTSAEATYSSQDVTFESTGVDVGSYQSINQNSGNLISYHWKANGSGSVNYNGSINSTVSANTTSGFSIVSYTGNGTGNSTVGHGLGATPSFIIVKNLTTAQAWGTKSDSFVSASDPNVLYLNSTAAQADDTNVWGTSAVFNNNTFTVGDWNGSNQSSSNFIAYCFAEKQGYSKFGSYVGNGNANGTFVYTGFKPAFVLAKKTNEQYTSWIMLDNKRANSFNSIGVRLFANVSSAEDTSSPYCDFLSNCFKFRTADNNANDANDTYIYMAFAENPLVANSGTDGVPTTAR